VKPERDGFVSVAYSEHPVPTTAVGEVAAYLIEHDLARPDVLVVLVTTPFAGILEDIAPALRKLLSPTTLVGCAAAQIIGPDGWLIDGPAIAVMAINTGEVVPLRFAPGDPLLTPEAHTAVLLADPFSASVSLLSDFCGGYATAGHGPGANRLVLDGELFTDGIVGIAFPATERIHSVADPFTLSDEERNSATAILAFTEVDPELWAPPTAREWLPVLYGFVSKRTFPRSLTVFGEENACEQENTSS
jgi:small ligand-binding sensory domain FIST